MVNDWTIGRPLFCVAIVPVIGLTWYQLFAQRLGTASATLPHCCLPGRRLYAYTTHRCWAPADGISDKQGEATQKSSGEHTGVLLDMVAVIQRWGLGDIEGWGMGSGIVRSVCVRHIKHACHTRTFGFVQQSRLFHALLTDWLSPDTSEHTPP